MNTIFTAPGSNAHRSSVDSPLCTCAAATGRPFQVDREIGRRISHGDGFSFSSLLFSELATGVECVAGKAARHWLEVHWGAKV